MNSFLENLMASLTDSLTKIRTVQFVRNLQFILVLITLTLVTYLLAIPFFGQEKLDLSIDGEFSEGKLAPSLVISSKEIIYEDDEKTKKAREKAFENSPLVFHKDYSVLQTVINTFISEDMDALREFQGYERSNYNLIRQKIPRWKNRTNEELKLLVDYQRKDKLKASLQQYTNLVFTGYCVLKDPFEEFKNIEKTGARIINEGFKEKISQVESSQVILRSAFFKDQDLMSRLNLLALEKSSNLNPELTPIMVKLTLYYIYSFPACVYHPEETHALRNKSKEKIEPLKSKISANEVIVKQGDIITPETYQKLVILNKYATRANLSSIASILIVQLVFVAIIAVFLRKYKPKRLNDVSSNIIIFSAIWILVGTAYIAQKYFYYDVAGYESVYYFSLFVPLGMVCLLIGFIYDAELAVAIGFYLSLFIFFASRYNPTSFSLALSTAVVASSYSRLLRKRLDFLKAGFYLSLVQMLVSTSGYLFDSRDYWVSNPSGKLLSDLFQSNIMSLYGVCLLNGFGSAITAQILLPIYEYIFNVPTRFKLIELADTGHPLLQQLLTKAPSTYTHTFLVAAMSERAAQNLGLDWLLTRVGVYFHDIGKIPNAGFFIENQHLIPKPENIDKNNPSIAAKVVIDHVLDGIEMAKKARLPREIINFIPEHHGTSTMAFFYHKALATLPTKQRKKISKRDFQYPGPIPQSKETGIVMIADSLEAASRSLDEITPEALDNLIQKIINSKLAENQLDESGLTLGDLEVVKQSFKEVLLSSLHQRPKYPKPEETKELEKLAEEKKTTPSKKFPKKS